MYRYACLRASASPVNLLKRSLTATSGAHTSTRRPSQTAFWSPILSRGQHRAITSTMQARSDSNKVDDDWIERLMQLDLEMSNAMKNTDFSKQFRTSAAERGNCPTGARDYIFSPDHPEKLTRLWIVDRILEPQTVPNFFAFLGVGILPNGERTSKLILTEEEIMLLIQPYSDWAAAPFNNDTQSAIDICMGFLGSEEDARQLIPIVKELKAMKSRLWEGIPPLSERRWREMGLDHPDNFDMACKYLAMTTDAFSYLHQPAIKGAMRDTYNRIYDALETFENALNVRRSQSGQRPLSVTSLWYEYVYAHYSFIASRAHRWAIGHIETLREHVLEQMANHTFDEDDGQLGPTHFVLADKIFDLTENAASADIYMYLAMDGYKGSGVEAQDTVQLDKAEKAPYREYPIECPMSIMKRSNAYHGRLKYLTRVESWRGSESQNPGFGPGGMNLNGADDALGVLSQCRSQAKAQENTRAELRGSMGLPNTEGRELWIQQVRLHMSMGGSNVGFLAYRTSFEHTEEEWELFKTKFEADLNDWGRDLGEIDDIRALCKVQWVDVKESKDIPTDVDGATRHFRKLAEDGAIAANFQDGFFLVADKSSIDSYLHPRPQQTGFVVAVDNNFDREDTSGYRMDEMPGYDGQVRVLTSLLWDDITPQILRQTQYLEDMWPLAMQHELQVYEGPWVKEDKIRPGS